MDTFHYNIPTYLLLYPRKVGRVKLPVENFVDPIRTKLNLEHSHGTKDDPETDFIINYGPYSILFI